MNMFNIYFAGPLFSLAERQFNTTLAEALRRRIPNLTFILPQDQAVEIKDPQLFVEQMFEYCIHSIDEADAVLCVLDGSDADSGTSVEIGYAYAHHKPIIGIRTDFRSSEDKGVNLMVSRVCRELLWLSESNITFEKVVDEVATALNRVLEQQ